MGTLNNGEYVFLNVFKMSGSFLRSKRRKIKSNLRGKRCTPNPRELFRKRTKKVLCHVVLLHSSQHWRWMVKASLKQNSYRQRQGHKYDKFCTWFKLSLVIKSFIINPHAEDWDSYCSWGFSDWKNETFAALLLFFFSLASMVLAQGLAAEWQDSCSELSIQTWWPRIQRYSSLLLCFSIQ